MNNLLYWLWISSIDDVGPVTAKRLLEHFGEPENIWEASEWKLQQVYDIGEKTSATILASRNLDWAQKELEKIKKHNVEIITINDENYPYHLKRIYDPPILLYSKGNLADINYAIGIVGARNATSYGLKVANDLGRQLGEVGACVVSGMARGIDTAAHKGALDGGGKTIAVLGCGIDLIYPYENKELMRKITENGAVVSEYPIGTIPDHKNFPRRNRIISGISLGTIVVEANKKSGSLITADFALEQNREVFAVPGQIFSRASEGTNHLIKQGAKIVTCLQDILEELNLEIKNDICIEENNQVDYNKLDLNDEERVIFSCISNMPMHLDNIIKQTGFSITKLNTIITMMELKGLITQLPGKHFVRS